MDRFCYDTGVPRCLATFHKPQIYVGTCPLAKELARSVLLFHGNTGAGQVHTFRRLDFERSKSVMVKNELFVFTENMVFESTLYKGTSKNPLLFDIVLRLYQVQINVEFIMHIIPIAGT